MLENNNCWFLSWLKQGFAKCQIPNNIIFICNESTKFLSNIPPFFKQDNITLKMVARFCKWLPKLTRIFLITLDLKNAINKVNCSGLQRARQKIALFIPKLEISSYKWFQDGFINEAQYPQCDPLFGILRYVDTRKCYIKHIWWGICLRSLGETKPTFWNVLDPKWGKEARFSDPHFWIFCMQAYLQKPACTLVMFYEH